MTSETQQKIITQFQKETGLSFNKIDQLLNDNNIKILDEKSILLAMDKRRKIINDIVIPKEIRRVPDWNGNRYNPITREKIPKYKTVIYYENGIKEKEVRQLKREKERNEIIISYLDLLLRITKRFSNNVSLENQEPESLLTNNKSDFSGHRELVKAIDRLVTSEKFKALQIPKNDSLNSTQIIKIKKLFREQNPGKKINWSSFFTKLKTKYDYSESRDKK